MSAARANNASFSDEDTFLFIISVKLTNYVEKAMKMYLENYVRPLGVSMKDK